ncbi:hypothetical protein [Streptomyces mirabilis]|uniref:hypothetical protein n=1 Tax=Streptomyces mirabilis TaxID=68239 RepID=UPI003659C5CE
MPIHAGMAEDLAAGTLSLYQQAEERLLGIIARQLADGLDAPGWAERQLSAVQAAAIPTETGAAAPDPVVTFPMRVGVTEHQTAAVAAAQQTSEVMGQGARGQPGQGQ